VSPDARDSLDEPRSSTVTTDQRSGGDAPPEPEPSPGDAAPGSEPSPPTDETDRWLRWVLWAALVVPVLAAAVAGARAGWLPTSDWALIELRVRDVGSHTPVLGPFSRFGWNHPGPLMFWVLALPYRLAGSSSDGLLVGAALVNLATVGTTGWVAWRTGRLALLAFTTLGLSIVVAGQGADFLVDPWNPTIVTLPFVLLSLTTWAIARGDHRLVVLWAVTASWIVQAHVGFTPFVGLLGAWALGWLLWPRRRDAAVWRWLAVAAVVAVVLWMPPLWEQATERPGNMVEFVRHFLGDSDEPTAGGNTALEVYGRHLALDGVWLGGGEPRDPFTGALVGRSAAAALPTLVIFAAATALALRHRRRDAVLLAGQVAMVLVAGVVATARITGWTHPYLFGWLSATVLVLWLSVAWSLWRTYGEQASLRARRAVLGSAGAMAVVLAVVATASSWGTGGPLPHFEEAARELRPGVTATVGDDTVLVRSTGTCLSEVAYGVALQIERAGGAVVVTDDLVSRYGEHRRFDGTNADATVTVACQEEVGLAQAAAAEDSDVAVVATYDPVPADLEDSEAEIRANLIAALDAMGRDDLVADVATDWIVWSGPDQGVPDEVLDPLRELLSTRGDRVVVLFGPPPD
jgi:hypothetical protein